MDFIPEDERRGEHIARCLDDGWGPSLADLLGEPDLKHVCRGGPCSIGNRCDNCRALNLLLAVKCREQEEYALDLRRLEGLCRVYPDEVRTILAPVVIDLVEAWADAEDEE